MQVLIIEALLLLFLIFITVCILISKDILACTIIYSAFSFCAVLTYFMFGSPDVAFTEAVIRDHVDHLLRCSAEKSGSVV